MTLRPEPYLHLESDRVFRGLTAFAGEAAAHEDRERNLVRDQIIRDGMVEMGDLAGLPKSQLAVLPGTSHFMPPGSGVLDRAELMQAMIRPFLDAE